MEPLDDRELDKILQQWQAPGAPPSLAVKVLPQRPSWWSWVLTGTIPVPVPLGIALVVAIAVFFYFRPPNRPEPAQPSKSVSLADFQPVKQLEPRIIGRTNETN
ncbi:MAG TPA: hypothetical protein VGQ49_16400 [Bryobacteraceae bacterium]|jgi:hypothetical protein|nr:hypothetical protein [Bryobacteraceae bacterium]